MSHKNTKELSNDQRTEIANYLFQHVQNGKLKRGVIKATSEVFKRSRQTISAIWKRMKMQLEKYALLLRLRS